MAPVGLYERDPLTAFELGCDVAALTHGHPSGYLASGMLAALISMIMQGETLERAVGESLRILQEYDRHEEVLAAVNRAVELSADASAPQLAHIEELGQGWVAEEALAISLYCSLCAGDDFEKGVLAAVNHGGDSDSTGAITGNIIGAMYGRDVIPGKWVEALELRKVIEKLAADLSIRFEDTDEWFQHYPGG